MSFATRAPPSINVTVEPVEPPSGLTGEAARWCGCVDNGGGLRPDQQAGLRTTGMRERILALGGSLTIASGDNGVTVEAVILMDARY